MDPLIEGFSPVKSHRPGEHARVTPYREWKQRRSPVWDLWWAIPLFLFYYACLGGLLLIAAAILTRVLT